MKNKIKAEAGRLGGRAVTLRKSETSKQNGRLGGRPTAVEAYRRGSLEVIALLDEVKAHLVSHAARQKTDSTNWGYVGDLELYAEKLNAILGREPHYYSTPMGRVTIPDRGEECTGKPTKVK